MLRAIDQTLFTLGRGQHCLYFLQNFPFDFSLSTSDKAPGHQAWSNDVESDHRMTHCNIL